MTFHAMTEHYEEITVCGKPALFTSIRITTIELFHSQSHSDSIGDSWR